MAISEATFYIWKIWEKRYPNRDATVMFPIVLLSRRGFLADLGFAAAASALYGCSRGEQESALQSARPPVQPAEGSRVSPQESPRTDKEIRDRLRGLLSEHKRLHDVIERIALLPGWTRNELEIGVDRFDQFVEKAPLTLKATGDPNDLLVANQVSNEFYVNVQFWPVLVEYATVILLKVIITFVDRLARRQERADAILRSGENRPNGLSYFSMEDLKTVVQIAWRSHLDTFYYAAASLDLQATDAKLSIGDFVILRAAQRAGELGVPGGTYITRLSNGLLPPNAGMKDQLLRLLWYTSNGYVPGRLSLNQTNLAFSAVAGSNIGSQIIASFAQVDPKFGPSFDAERIRRVIQDPLVDAGLHEWAISFFGDPRLIL